MTELMVSRQDMAVNRHLDSQSGTLSAKFAQVCLFGIAKLLKSSIQKRQSYVYSGWRLGSNADSRCSNGNVGKFRKLYAQRSLCMFIIYDASFQAAHNSGVFAYD